MSRDGGMGASGSRRAGPSGTGSDVDVSGLSTVTNKDRWKPYKMLDCLEDPPELVTEADAANYPWMVWVADKFRKEDDMPKAKVGVCGAVIG